MKKRLRKGESGFAVLLVFAMAATIALLLYMELPREAFEAQRDREAVLISRGEAYKRAIQLYFRKFKTYPTSIDALENTNNVRFLRRRYPDPLTGKDDWRLIHIGPGGVFTDSLTNKPKTNQPASTNTNNFITEGQSLSGDAAPTDQPLGPAFRRRPSEGGQQQQDTSGDLNAPLPPTGEDPNAPQPPATGDQPPAEGGTAPGQTAGQIGLGQTLPTSPTQGQQPSGGQTQPVSGLQGIPGLPFNPGSQPQGGAPTDPNSPGMPTTGNPGAFGPGNPNLGQGGSNAAAALIQGLLTQPRSMPTGQNTATGGMQIAAGSIAGVASKVERRGIKIYNDHNKYNEWEFIYDFSKDRTGAGQLAGMMGQPQAGQQQPGQQPGTALGVGGQSPFGSGFTSGFGGQGQQSSSPGTQTGPLSPTSSSPQQ